MLLNEGEMVLEHHNNFFVVVVDPIGSYNVIRCFKVNLEYRVTVDEPKFVITKHEVLRSVRIDKDISLPPEFFKVLPYELDNHFRCQDIDNGWLSKYMVDADDLNKLPWNSPTFVEYHKPLSID